jgi:hypothetical protein
MAALGISCYYAPTEETEEQAASHPFYSCWRRPYTMRCSLSTRYSSELNSTANLSAGPLRRFLTPSVVRSLVA